MKTYIALLRGINVGGHKKVPMAELRDVLTKSGLTAVKTYIQSGNVIFQYQDIGIEVLELKIQKIIIAYFGFEVSVLVRTKTDIETLFNDCPFSEEKKTNSYFIILREAPETDLIAEISKLTTSAEEFIITKNCIYIFYALGAGKGKLGVNFFERKLKITATARNYKTMVKLLSLSTEI